MRLYCFDYRTSLGIAQDADIGQRYALVKTNAGYVLDWFSEISPDGDLMVSGKVKGEATAEGFFFMDLTMDMEYKPHESVQEWSARSKAYFREVFTKFKSDMERAEGVRIEGYSGVPYDEGIDDLIAPSLREAP